MLGPSQDENLSHSLHFWKTNRQQAVVNCGTRWFTPTSFRQTYGGPLRGNKGHCCHSWKAQRQQAVVELRWCEVALMCTVAYICMPLPSWQVCCWCSSSPPSPICPLPSKCLGCLEASTGRCERNRYAGNEHDPKTADDCERIRLPGCKLWQVRKVHEPHWKARCVYIMVTKRLV